MKKLTLVLLVLLSGTMFAQQVPGVERAAFVKQWATYVNATIDTTGWIYAIPGTNKQVSDMKELVLIFTANDSVQAAVYVNGRNSKIQYSGVQIKQKVYADSISSILFLSNGVAGFTANPFFGTVVLKNSTINRLAGCDNFRVAVDFTAASGVRAGRVCKMYLWGKE